MIAEKRTVVLKTGIKCELETPKIEDAEELMRLVVLTKEETDFLISYPEEIKISVQDEEVFIRNLREDARDCMLVARINGEIAGCASISAVGNRMKIRHRCTFGISVLKKYWSQGIGRALMEELMKVASSLEYTQMELGVFACNERAVRLYEKMGFVCTGEIVDAFILKDGTRINEKLMQRNI